MAEEEIRTAVIRKHWQLANEAAGRLHLEVANGRLQTHVMAAPPGLDVVMSVQERRQAAEAARQQAEADKAALIRSTDTITAQGIFLGQYSPKDRDGNSLGKTFNVFAAPQDLTDEHGRKEVFTYNDAVKRISELQRWNGFDGSKYANDTELYQALKDGSYHGEWVIPTADLLVGEDGAGNKTQSDSLLTHMEKGSFKYSYTTTPTGNDDDADWYWSCTENRHNPSLVACAQLSNCEGDWNPKDHSLLSCRPVRLVPVKSP